MRYFLILFVMALLSVAVVAADFSGTWILNKDKSELGEGGGGRMAAAKMVVVQKENSLSITRTVAGRDGEERTMTDEMTLDGKETKTTTERGESIFTAKMDGEVLAVTAKRKFQRDGETFESTSEQKWKLDGGALFVDVKSESSRGTREFKLVYDKQ